MGKMISASAPYSVGSSACRIEVHMSDFHTWNALQEDTTGRSAYADANSHLLVCGRPGSNAMALTSYIYRIWWPDRPGAGPIAGFNEALRACTSWAGGSG